jgi:hypothetical protein
VQDDVLAEGEGGAALMETTLQRFTMPDGAVVDVHFDFAAWFNATEAAKPFNTEPAAWLRSKRAVDYLAALSASLQISQTDLVRTQMGRPDQGGGTWMHPDLAIEFARSLNPYFGVQCDQFIKAMLQGKLSALPAPHCDLADGRLIEVVKSTIRQEFAQLKIDLLVQERKERRPISDSVKNTHLRCLAWRGWRCPLTGDVITRADVEFDHHFGNQFPGLEHTWPLATFHTAVQSVVLAQQLYCLQQLIR